VYHYAMNRLEHLRAEIDRRLLALTNEQDLRCGFVHLYGVSATAALLARVRGLDEELAAAAGMLHDLISYEAGEPLDHAPRGAVQAKEILEQMKAFTADEISCIASAIAHHSEKALSHGPYEELLKDADVLQHDLYNPQLPPDPRHAARRAKLRQSLSPGA
jgi:HD superfamily phosphodiesterase